MYLMYAERWHWTPDQVDALPAWVDAQLPQLVEAYDAVQAEKQRAAGG